MYSSFQFQLSKNESVTCEFEMYFEKSFSWRSNLGNDNIISVYVNMYVAFSDHRQVLNTGMDFWAQVWKRVWKMTVFGLTELGVGEPGITPPPPLTMNFQEPPLGGGGCKGWRWAVFFVLNSIFFPKNLISWCQFKIIQQLICMRKKTETRF